MQAAEHIDEQNYLNERIEALEEYLVKLDGTLELMDQAQEPELKELLTRFLTQYSTWAFSPARIRVWGSVQPGYEGFASYEPRLIRRTLQKMVSEQQLVTRVSKKGNTLYQIPKT